MYESKTMGKISPQIISVMIKKSPKITPTCLCCSTALLQHMRSGKIYWRCSYCRQEMPISERHRPESHRKEMRISN
jgi:hypothetical protein